MKRGGPLPRRTRLTARKGLERRTPLTTRTPLKAKRVLPRKPPASSPRNPPRRRKPMKVKAPRDAGTWRKARAEHLAAFPSCEVGRLTPWKEPCGRRPVQVHHVRNGGLGRRDHSRTNLLTLCAHHHVGDAGIDSGCPDWTPDAWAFQFFGVESYQAIAVLVAESRR